MFCIKCGNQLDDNSKFCPACGNPVARNEQPEQQFQQNQFQQQFQQNQFQQPNQNYYTQNDGGSFTQPIARRLVSVLSSQLFLTVCILISAKVILGLLSKSLPVLDILFCIFFWLTYTTALKGSPADDKIRMISGTTLACEILGYVGAGLIAVAGFLWTTVASIISSPSFYGRYGSEAWIYFQQYLNYYGLNYAALSGIIIAVCLVVAVIVFLIIFFGWRNIHKFVKSLYQSVQYGNRTIEKRGTAQTWLMIFGVLNALAFIGSLANGNMVSALANGCGAAAFIMISVMIGSNFNDYK